MSHTNYPACDLGEDLLDRVKALEVDLRNATHKQVVLIAYNKEEGK